MSSGSVRSSVATAEVDDEAALVDDDHPWPGLVAFTEAASPFFFGRRADATDLVRMIRQDQSVLVFGRSGLGKTSLMQAGVFPLLRDDGEFLPIAIRLSYQDGAPPLGRQTLAALLGGLIEAGIPFPNPDPGDDLWSFLHRRDVADAIAAEQGPIPVLVFDQFEEMFALGQANPERSRDCRAFTEGLANLIENRCPSWLRERLRDRPELGPVYRLSEHGYRIVVMLREDYLPSLETLNTRAPSFGRSRLRLMPMTGRQAFQAVVKPGRSLVSLEVAKEIVRYLGRMEDNRGLEIDQDNAVVRVDPALLSLFCRELNRRRIADGLEKIDSSLLSGVSNEILKTFYEEAFSGIPDSVRTLIEDELVTESGARTDMLLERAMKSVGKVDGPSFDLLVNRRILQRDERQSLVHIELVHDVLIDVVTESRRLRAQNAEVARAVEAETARRRAAMLWWRNILAGVAAASLIVALIAVSRYTGILSARGRADAQRRMFGCIVTQLAPPEETVSSLDYQPSATLTSPQTLLAATITSADCGTGFWNLVKKAHETPGEAVSLVASMASLSSSGTWQSRVDQIDQVIAGTGIEGEVKDYGTELLSARLIEAQILAKAGQLARAQAATRKALAALAAGATIPGSDSEAKAADIYSSFGERSLLAKPSEAEAILQVALQKRLSIFKTELSQRKAVLEPDRRALAQAYADVGRAKANEVAPAIGQMPKSADPALTASNAAKAVDLLAPSDRYYAMCRSTRDGALAGLSKSSDLYQSIAARCFAHQAITLQKIDPERSVHLFQRELDLSNIDLDHTRDSDKQQFYDVLNVMAGHYQASFLGDRTKLKSAHTAAIFRKWAMIAQRDVFSRDPTRAHRDGFVLSMMELVRLYDLEGRRDEALEFAEPAFNLDSTNPQTAIAYGTALFLKGGPQLRCRAELKFRTAIAEGGPAMLATIRKTFAEIENMSPGDGPDLRNMLDVLSSPKYDKDNSFYCHSTSGDDS